MTNDRRTLNMKPNGMTIPKPEIKLKQKLKFLFQMDFSNGELFSNQKTMFCEQYFVQNSMNKWQFHAEMNHFVWCKCAQRAQLVIEMYHYASNVFNVAI